MSNLKRHIQRRSVRSAKQSERPQPILKTPREIQIMREAGRIVARVHAELKEVIRPGVSTLMLDQVAAEVLSKHGATSSFLGYKGYPAHICASINEELVHGIPSQERILQEGDIISVDIGAFYRGFIGDSGWTYAVGEVSNEAKRLMEVTEASLFAGIKQALADNRIRDISAAVQQHVEAANMHIVREYTGHGVGRSMHEAPQVLNYVSGDIDGNLVIEPGLVIALEPMVQVGTWETRTLKDKWTVISRDRSLSAHFEHTVAVTNKGPEILTLP
jgi:methionyl aminopeptidase